MNQMDKAVQTGIVLENLGCALVSMGLLITLVVALILVVIAVMSGGT